MVGCWNVNRSLVLDALKILVSIGLGYVGWGNSLVAESLQHCCTCFLNFGFSSSAFISQPSRLVTPTLISLKSDLPEVLLRSSHGLLPNEKGFLHLSCSQIFSLEIDFTNTIGSFSQLSVVIKFGEEGLTSDTSYASLCFRLPFAVFYKLYIISCFNKSCITLAQSVMLLN